MPLSKPELENAYAECERIARGHYENFPVGSLLIPKKLRPHFYALYAFMRSADDFADLSYRSSVERLAALHAWRSHLADIFEDKAISHPIFVALRNTVRQFSLERAYFDRLLDAFDFDARGDVHFQTFADLHWYTQRSAEPVGQLVLALFGYTDSERIEASNNICTALQLINFLQDAKEDIANGRCYFPLDDMQRFGIQSLNDLRRAEPVDRLVKHECDRIEQLLAGGRRLPSMLSGRIRLEIKAVLRGADMMLAKIRTCNSAIFDERPSLNAGERRMLLAKALLPF